MVHVSNLLELDFEFFSLTFGSEMNKIILLSYLVYMH